jgi:branched-chain amino acid transport system ATP-binding protein
MNTAIQLEGLEGGYGRLTVFRNISCTIAPEQTVGLLGPNGAGKTTLLNSIVGALPSHAGRILFEGRDITHYPAYQRARLGLVLVPQGRHVLNALTVHDNLALTRAIEGYRPDLNSFQDRLAEVYQLFPRLKERASQLGGSLSGGEQQMLAIGRALLLKPKVLMLDEPTQGLAPIVVQNLAATLAKLKGRFAMIVVEQNKPFLERLTERILLLRAGTLQLAGSKDPK